MQREAHANGERIRPGMAIVEVADERLQQRRGDLIGQRDHPDLPEVEMEGSLQQRINRRDQRLNHVVQEVAEGGREQDRENQFLGDMFRRFGLSRAGGGLHRTTRITFLAGFCWFGGVVSYTDLATVERPACPLNCISESASFLKKQSKSRKAKDWLF